jgi:hypothetical protein
MIKAEKETIITFFRDYFLGLFGDNSETAVAEWGKWVNGVDKWYTTPQGMIMSHIFHCYRIALQAQARLFVVLSGKTYVGCAVLGYRFSVIVNGAHIVPEASKDVRSAAADMDLHSRALDWISRKLRSLDVAAGAMEDDQPILFSSAREVYREINRRVKLEGQDLDELTEHLASVTFYENYWSASHVDKILRAIRLLTSEDEIEAALPMHLAPSLIYDTSREFQVLSAFGPAAPSFVNERGTVYPIPEGPNAKDPLSEVDPLTGKPRLSKIYVAQKNISVAVNDMRSVLKKRSIRMDLGERAGAYRTIEYTNTARNQIWDALKQIPFKSHSVVAGKRKADDGDSDEERAPKRQKERASKSDEVDMSMFE